MKRTLLITFAALISCFVAEAQLRTIKPSSIFKIPNISHATYVSGDYYNEENPLFFDLHCGPYNCTAENVVASSSLSSQGSANYRVSNIKDCNHETAWVEGVKGHGVGEWIEFQGISDAHIGAITILNGYVKSDKAWSENSRVKRLKVYCNDRPVFILELHNSRSMQTFYVGDFIGDYFYIDKLSFEILEVYPGTKYPDTCISEIVFTSMV